MYFSSKGEAQSKSYAICSVFHNEGNEDDPKSVKDTLRSRGTVGSVTPQTMIIARV